MIYKAAEGQQITKYKLVKSELRSFEDALNSNSAVINQYAIRVVYKNGGESKISPIIKPEKQ